MALPHLSPTQLPQAWPVRRTLGWPSAAPRSYGPRFAGPRTDRVPFLVQGSVRDACCYFIIGVGVVMLGSRKGLLRQMGVSIVTCGSRTESCARWGEQLIAVVLQLPCTGNLKYKTVEQGCLLFVFNFFSMRWINFKINFGFLLLSICLVQGCTSACDKPGAGNWLIKMPMLVKPQADSIRLGDTLYIEVRIPYDNINTRNGEPRNVAAAIPTNFAIELTLHNRFGNAQPIIEGVNNFEVTSTAGSIADFNEAGKRATFMRTPDAFLFRAQIVPRKRGLLSLGIYNATGDPGIRCAVVTYGGECINTNCNHLLYQQLYQVFTDFIPPGKYFTWVR